MGMEEIREKYIDSRAAANLENQRAELNRSFASCDIYKSLNSSLYEKLQALYDDANTVFQESGLEDTEKQTLLYPIYEAFYETLAGLPWKERKHCQAEKHIKAMKACLKKGQNTSASLQYWIDFAKYAGPCFLAFFGLELLFLLLLDKAPAWLLALIFLGFLASLAAYFLVVYHIEGRRQFGTLQKWIWFRAAPKDHSRPIDLLQAAKAAIPLVVALGGAFIRMYVK